MTLVGDWRHERWRLYAPVYDWAAKPFEGGRRRAIDRLAPGPNDRVLLVGCGTGLDLPHLPREASVTALDIVGTNLRRTAGRADDLDRSVQVCLGDAGTLPFDDGAFDAVLLHLVLSVVPDPDAVVAETERVLAPDGRVSIYDKFLPDGERPSLVRRGLNPVARVFFSDLTRQLGPMLDGTGLDVLTREWVLGGLYSVAVVGRESP